MGQGLAREVSAALTAVGADRPRVENKGPAV
jgi:hypothetical protein